jgi:hypothetical protein
MKCYPQMYKALSGMPSQMSAATNIGPQKPEFGSLQSNHSNQLAIYDSDR